jgi:hypothetical protein
MRNSKSSKMERQWLLQIRNVDPAIIRQFKIYAVTQGMTHAQVFTAGFLLLSKQLSPKEEKEASAPRAHGRMRR